MKFLKYLLIPLLIFSLGFITSCGKQENLPKKNVTVYSPLFTDAITDVTNGFTEKTGVSVDVIAAGTGELLRRVEAESSNPLGDLVFGGGAESLDAYRNYFDSYKVKGYEGIDSRLEDPNYKWFGFASIPIVIIYNSDLIDKSQAPTSWADLLKPQWKGRIAFASPVKSGSSYTAYATMLSIFGRDNKKGKNFIKAFIENIDGKTMESSSGVPKGVVEGEYAIGITLESSAIKYKNAGGKIEIVYPSEGTAAVPDGAALIKGAKNYENAKLFLDYIASKEVQSLLASKYGIRGAREDILLPKGLGPIKDVNLIDYDFSWASKSKKDNLKLWKDIISGRYE